MVATARKTGGAFAFRDLQGLLALVATSAESGEGSELEVQLKALPGEEQESLWHRVLEVAGVHLQAEKLAAGPGGADFEEASKTVHAVATLIAAFAEGALDSSSGGALPSAFADVASRCQELLLSIPDGRTQFLIAHALERICTGAFEGREDFYGGVLMYLVGCCLGPKTTAADVNRLYRVKDLLTEMDWEHESIESLKMQLMRCVASPAFVRNQHGADLIALFFTVHGGFTAEVHSTVKNQVLYSRGAGLKAYSLALFKAWKASEAGTRLQVEHCVQDWVVLAIRTARKSADRARSMLEEIHRHHHEEAVNELLCRLYGPLLWRSLKVANCQVRENSVRLLQYVFPLIPAELGVADKEQELAKQLVLLRETLEDPSEPVRRVGVSAVCIILKNYWDLVPPAEIAELLTVLMNRCACDRKAPMVRAAVAEGFSWILENVLSHPTMAAVLPQISELMNDRSPMVRAAFVDLLNAVSHCRGVSVGVVVSNESLLLRLASEHTEGQAERLQKGLQSSKNAGIDARPSPDVVAKHLAKLMAPSLFQQDLVQQVARCHYLMQYWPLALLALLSHLKDITPAPERVKLAAALFRYGLREVSGVATSGSQASQPKMVATILRVVGVLLEGTAEPSRCNRKKGGGGHFPKELEAFVYEHIREEDFLNLFEGEGHGSTAADLLFALSPLDPARLPRTAELVQSELQSTCRGVGPPSLPRLAALLRTAVRWGLLGDALEPAWERLLAAAARLKLRQLAADDTAGAAVVVEVAFRDPEVREAILPAKVEALRRMVEAIVGAFCSAWSGGFSELCKPSKGHGELMLLGPAAEVWPRILGLAIRVALHIDSRMNSSIAPFRKVPVMHDGSAAEVGGVSGSKLATAVQDVPMEVSDLAEATLCQLAEVLTSGPAAQALDVLEALCQEKSVAPPPAKRARVAKGAKSNAVVMPSDLDAVLQVHERLLEAANVSHFLAALKIKAGTAGPVAFCDSGLLAGGLSDRLWRWSCAADALRPREGGPRLPQIWVLMGRLLQQMAYSDVPIPDVIGAAHRLLGRVDDGIPAEDAELRRVLQALFGRLEYDPQLVQLVAGLTGNSVLGEKAIDTHPRVRKVVGDLLPSFRNLRAKFLQKEAGEEEQRRLLAGIPTPQRARGPDGDEESADDGASEGGRRSFSVRSRSPPSEAPDSGRTLDSLFNACFDGGKHRPVSVHSRSSRPASSGEDVD